MTVDENDGYLAWLGTHPVSVDGFPFVSTFISFQKVRSDDSKHMYCEGIDDKRRTGLMYGEGSLY